MPAAEILIIAKDPLKAAIMGAVVELSGHRPRFANADERPLDAIARIRPRLILLDCGHDLACEDAVYDRARAAGAHVLLYSPASRAADLRTLAAERRMPWIVSPLTAQRIGEKVSDVLTSLPSSPP